jgi:translation initiation factor 5B
MQVAISIDKGVVGRNISEGEILMVDVPEKHVKTLMSKFLDQLSEHDKETLNELIQIKRRESPVWGL